MKKTLKANSGHLSFVSNNMYDRMNTLFINGKTKKDMALKTGISYNTIKKFFQKRNVEKYNIDHFIAIANYLEKDIQYFLFNSPLTTTGGTITNDRLKKIHIQEISKIMANLEVDYIIRIYNFAEIQAKANIDNKERKSKKFHRSEQPNGHI